MAKVILVCGKIGSGKTTYAKALMEDHHAVLLSVDEVAIVLFGTETGKYHDLAVDQIKKVLFDKSLEFINSKINVILDWGFWTREDRQEAEEFYKEHGITYEWHYIDVPRDVMRRNLKKRNDEIKAGQIKFYYFEDELANRFWDMFEAPAEGEMDIIIN